MQTLESKTYKLNDASRGEIRDVSPIRTYPLDENANDNYTIGELICDTNDLLR